MLNIKNAISTIIIYVVGYFTQRLLIDFTPICNY